MNLRVAVSVLLMVGCVHAQSRAVLAGVEQGRRIRVTDKAGKQRTGTFVSEKADTIVIATTEGEASVDRAEVSRVELRTQARRLRNIAIGAGVGAAVGATIDGTLGARLRNESSGDGGRAVTYLLSIAAGAGIGALTSGWKTVYKVRSH